jgi:hypothetical protein
MGRWNNYREYRELELGVIREANYDYTSLDKVIENRIAEYEKGIAEIQAMTDEQFLTIVSQYIFGVASKSFYIDRFRKRIEELKQVKLSIDYLVEQCRDDPKLFEWILKNNCKGTVREMRNAIRQLALTLPQ